MRHLHLSSRTVTFSVVLRTWTKGSSHHCAPILDPGMMYLFFVIELAASVAVMHAPTDVDFSMMVDSFSMTVSALNRPHRGLLMFIILWIISFITFAFCHTCQPQLLNDGWLLLNDCHCAWMHSLSTLYDYNTIHYLNHRFHCFVCIGS